MNHIKENLSVVRQRIQLACSKAGRNPDGVALLLATKTVTPENIKVALQLGEFLIGENKVQELKEKFDALKNVPHQSHFIGHLQTNKIKEVIRYASCIQSVDRLDLVQKLDHRLQQEGRSLEIMIQVNTSDEESKFGIAPADAVDFARKIAQYDTLKVTGLMTIGLFSAEINRVRTCFRLLKQIQLQVKDLALPNIQPDQLSMGMSNDLECAIEEGATMIRVGTAVFGKRIYPDSYYWNESAIVK